MISKTKVGVFFVGVLACGGLMIAPATNAAEHPYHNTYATVGFDFTADPNQDGFPIGLTHGPAVGNFGKADIAMVTEWLIQPRECPAGFDVPFGVVNVATVTTYQDLSQMFSFANDGWMCLNSTTGTFFGEVSGLIAGGTGRFEGASGEYVSKFEGQILAPQGHVNFSAINGTTTGTLIVP